jgi:hypothetical protein
VYGYGQSSQQPQRQQPQRQQPQQQQQPQRQQQLQGQLSPPQQYAYSHQSYSSSDNHNNTSLPTYNSYMSSQQKHSNKNSPIISHEKIDSSHLNHKSREEFQQKKQQQYSYNSSIRDVPSSQQINSPNQSNCNSFHTAPVYGHMHSSPATSPIQPQPYTLNNNGHGGLCSVRISFLNNYLIKFIDASLLY